jgi:hypothetical protein
LSAVLEQLAGPFSLIGQDGNPTSFGVGIFGIDAFYDDDIGLGFCTLSGLFFEPSLADLVAYGYCIAQLDGKVCKRAHLPNGTFHHRFVLDLQNPGSYLARGYNVFNRVYLFDKHSGSVGTELLSSYPTGYSAQVRAADRYLHFSGNSVYTFPLTGGTVATTEATVSGVAFADTCISPTRKPSVVCISYESGKIIYYDVVAKTQTGPTQWIGANQAAWYSPKHDIFVAYASGQISIYSASVVRPSTLSNPVAVAPLQQGRLGKVRCQLLGSNADACAGELVNWSITAGPGALTKAQSATDANGYAENDFVAPVTGSGSVTIQAQVNF